MCDPDTWFYVKGISLIPRMSKAHLLNVAQGAGLRGIGVTLFRLVPVVRPTDPQVA